MKQTNAADFYKSTMKVLVQNGIEFLIGGASAFGHYTGIVRDTKDFDLMIRPGDAKMALEVCRNEGYEADFVFTHWLAKIWSEKGFIDIIFRSGNGLCEVDDRWFSEATEAEILETRVRVTPPEEMIWQKAYVMERERFDGADVAHLMASCGDRMNWQRLVERFGSDWRVLFSHLVLFGFIFPSRRDLIPREVMQDLGRRLMRESEEGARHELVCNGTLLSRVQYFSDVSLGELADARMADRCKIRPDELLVWTTAAMK